MLDILLELGGELIEWIGDLIDGADIADAVGDAASFVGDALLIGGAIYVASLTVDSIKSELRNRRELKEKGVTHVIILDFINQTNGYTEVSLAALNAQNQQVGTVKMQSKGSVNVYKGQRIAL